MQRGEKEINKPRAAELSGKKLQLFASARESPRCERFKLDFTRAIDKVPVQARFSERFCLTLTSDDKVRNLMLDLYANLTEKFPS